MKKYRRQEFYEVVQWHSKDRFELRWVTDPCPGEIRTGRVKMIETKEEDWSYYDTKKQLEDVPAPVAETSSVVTPELVKSSLKLEEGKWYRDREGKVWGPMVSIKKNVYYPFTDRGLNHTWTEFGQLFDTGEDPLDLVEEVQVPSLHAPVSRPAETENTVHTPKGSSFESISLCGGGGSGGSHNVGSGNVLDLHQAPVTKPTSFVPIK